MEKTGELRCPSVNDRDSGSPFNILRIIYIYSDSSRRDEAIGAIYSALACRSKKFVFSGTSLGLDLNGLPYFFQTNLVSIRCALNCRFQKTYFRRWQRGTIFCYGAISKSGEFLSKMSVARVRSQVNL